MIRSSRTIFGMSIWVLAILALSACAGRSYLIVDYQVPEISRQLSGQSVRLAVLDQRDHERILAPAAGYHFRGFQGQYSLAYVTPGKERVLAGRHDLSQLVRQTFRKRLEQMGASVGEAGQTHLPLLTIRLEQLRVDLQGRKWMAELKYDASLAPGDGLVVTESIHGNAERVRVVGRKGADTVLSDIFTDAVNRLNLLKLFRRAGVIS